MDDLSLSHIVGDVADVDDARGLGRTPGLQFHLKKMETTQKTKQKVLVSLVFLSFFLFSFKRPKVGRLEYNQLISWARHTHIPPSLTT